jgi:magnesium and cobalt exporter, CNNM family
VVIVVFTNIVNVLGPVLVGTKAVEIYGSPVIGAVTAILTLGTIIFSEIIPKSLGTHYAPGISLALAPALRWLIALFYPIVWIFEKLTNAMKSGERRVGTEEQIRSLARLGHSAGYIETDETQLVHRAFQLNDRTAADIMTPMDEVVTLEPTMTVLEAAMVVRESPYTRYPVVGPGRAGETSTVTGIVVSHDLLSELSRNRGSHPAVGLTTEPLIVGAESRADDLLDLFRRERFHLAVVLDADRPVGVVTLEDVLEELVGEITDERE